ncbi:hypothetical protein SEA_BANQUO_29 [Gordonia phage Banquo]|uniref:Uncharacterized protein n=1 Tax=Gordonia phage TinaLin TaxID=2797324 RepID=A0A7T7GTE6_9CAUD|nr:hypothetical protein KDJ60_gp28 [Gordonia phage TinaLin]QQM15117.1 hypothetical protein SEA_TINALIN_28 [Gordonia phage TinaLin]URM87360.1 hypothetical protein SEA_BANQUO_29 [Gordonia phage Banquo]
MSALADSVDVSAHPAVVWIGVAGAVVAGLAVIIPKIGKVIRDLMEDADGRRLARLAASAELDRQRIEHTARVEASAAILNDARVAALTGQLEGISLQLQAQRERYETQLADTQAALDEALAEITALREEIGQLRAEVAEYRDEHEGDGVRGSA